MYTEKTCSLPGCPARPFHKVVIGFYVCYAHSHTWKQSPEWDRARRRMAQYRGHPRADSTGLEGLIGIQVGLWLARLTVEERTRRALDEELGPL